jgi:hypothetical protein
MSRKSSEGDLAADEAPAAVDEAPKDPADSVPLRVDFESVPEVEWWDEAFLPKDIREARKKAARPIMSLSLASSAASSSGAGAGPASTEEFYAKVSIANAKTHM